jgi:hypothetical protein
MHVAMSLGAIWLCVLYIVLHLMDDAPELPWHD